MYGDLIAVLDTDGIDAWDGDDCSVTCPCGHRIEPDAPTCPDGCENPIVSEGLI